MQLRLRTKLTLVMTGLVLLVVAAVSGVYFALLLQQVLDQSEKRAQDIAISTFVQIKAALLNAEAQGWRPESDAPDDIRDYVSYALGSSQGLQARTSVREGFLCRRILPRGSHLKCFTALVM